MIIAIALVASLALQSVASPARPKAVTREAAEKVATTPLNINQAKTEDFARLPGIGPELARRIVRYREKHGAFKRVEDLLAVRGIGHKKWKRIRPYVTLGAAKSPS